MDVTLINAATRHLSKTDNVMARLIRQCEPIILSATKKPHYHSLVVAIINQQLSVKAGRTIEKRLQEKHGGRVFTAERILNLNDSEIRECGLSNNKVRYISTLAQAIVDGELNFRKLARLDNESVSKALIQYPGVGQWSVDLFLINSLRRADVFPIGDLVLRKSMQQHYQLTDITKHDEFIAIAEAWRPFRTIASYYLWKSN